MRSASPAPCYVLPKRVATFAHFTFPEPTRSYHSDPPTHALLNHLLQNVLSQFKMARRRKTKKPQNNENRHGPIPPPPVQRAPTTPNAGPVVYLPQQRFAVLQDMGTGWALNAPPQELPRAPRGATSAANLGWSHNNGTGMKGWRRPIAKTSAAPQRQHPAQPELTIADCYGRRPPLVEKQNGETLALYSYGRPTRAPPMPELWAREEPEGADAGCGRDATAGDKNAADVAVGSCKHDQDQAQDGKGLEWESDDGYEGW
ncbi:hypothetical protein EDC01DRAFT_432630 [Geopyxis carbonaria]|nr:hypothetical protein EDC01DRAFT_432630 [Geopyxis carbonaria]